MNCVYALQNDKYYDVYYGRSNDNGLFAEGEKSVNADVFAIDTGVSGIGVMNLSNYDYIDGQRAGLSFDSLRYAQSYADSSEYAAIANMFASVRYEN